MSQAQQQQQQAKPAEQRVKGIENAIGEYMKLKGVEATLKARRAKIYAPHQKELDEIKESLAATTKKSRAYYAAIEEWMRKHDKGLITVQGSDVVFEREMKKRKRPLDEDYLTEVALGVLQNREQAQHLVQVALGEGRVQECDKLQMKRRKQKKKQLGGTQEVRV